ncbi:hypothetical protein BJ508DRAFT_308718 [Ascobolus immersus RN42]|uniref:Uncharacterized protein n=1 Tax=Ascobolus immersus RN42 TaxID=1160509 RepID=A0A3N4I0Q1_ASCIM|nr:hypothetical protein BJ508DRAFT_308718 [Ascobolus immersus RN42]
MTAHPYHPNEAASHPALINLGRFNQPTSQQAANDLDHNPPELHRSTGFQHLFKHCIFTTQQRKNIMLNTAIDSELRKTERPRINSRTTFKRLFSLLDYLFSFLQQGSPKSTSSSMDSFTNLSVQLGRSNSASSVSSQPIMFIVESEEEGVVHREVFGQSFVPPATNHTLQNADVAHLTGLLQTMEINASGFSASGFNASGSRTA